MLTAILSFAVSAFAEDSYYIFYTECLGEVPYNTTYELTPAEILAIYDDLEGMCDIVIEEDGPSAP